MGWQPIETAPKDGTRVLLLIAADGQCFIGQFYPEYDEWADDEILFCTPTLWHPLPPPPETP